MRRETPRTKVKIAGPTSPNVCVNEGDVDGSDESSSKSDSDDEQQESSSEIESSSADKADRNITKSAQIWYRRLGHSLPAAEVRRQVRARGLPQVRKRTNGCDICVKGKYRKSYTRSLTKFFKRRRTSLCGHQGKDSRPVHSRKFLLRHNNKRVLPLYLRSAYYN